MNDFFQLHTNEITAILLSLKVAILCALLSIPFAIGLGYILARKNFWGKSIIESIITLPLVMPPVATGYLLLLFLGTKGIIGRWLFDLFGIKLAFSFSAVIIATIVVSFPLFVRSVRTSMEMVDKKLEEAARTLGHSRISTFFRITIPLAAPGIVSGLILSFARSLGEFGATISFAGNIAGETQTLSLAVFSYMQIPGQETPTLRLVIIAVLISFIAMALSEYIIKRLRRAR